MVAVMVARSGLILIVFRRYHHHDLLMNWMWGERGRQSWMTPWFMTRASRKIRVNTFTAMGTGVGGASLGRKTSLVLDMLSLR